MSTSSEDLTRKEELSDERVLNDIRRSIKAREASDALTDIEIRALAVQGVEQYWVERDILVGDTTYGDNRSPETAQAYAAGRMRMSSQLDTGDDIALSFRLASRKLADLQDGFTADKTLLLLALPVIGALLALLFLPSFADTSARLFQNEKLALYSGVSAGILVLLIVIQQWQWGDRIQWRTGWRYSLGLFAGVMIAATLIIVVGLQRGNAAQRIAHERIRDVVRDKIEQGGFENTPNQTQTITFDNKKTVRMTPNVINKDRLEYRAEGEGLPSPVEVKINKNSGELSIMKEGGKTEPTAEFVVGKVEAVSENKLTLRVENEVKSVPITGNYAAFGSTVGQKVFVTIDPVSKTATDIERVTESAPKTPPEAPKKSLEN